MTDICVVGSFMMDLVATAERRPNAGETVMGTSFAMHLGGKGFNQAVAAARSGASTCMVGAVGADSFGDRFLAALEDEGIDAGNVRRLAEEGTGVGLPLVEPSGENSIVIIPRANHALGVADVEAAAEAIESAAMVLVQFELPLEVSLAAARIAAKAGTKVMVNPAPALDCPKELMRYTDYLVPNEHEGRKLSGAETTASPEDVSARLLERWDLHAVIVTVGPDGMVVNDNDGPRRVEATKVDAVDTVGAGDAFCGALAAELVQGVPLAEAVHYAGAAAGVAVTRPGAMPSMPRRSEVEELIGGESASSVTVGARPT
jgi:ribokinase